MVMTLTAHQPPPLSWSGSTLGDLARLARLVWATEPQWGARTGVGGLREPRLRPRAAVCPRPPPPVSGEIPPSPPPTVSPPAQPSQLSTPWWAPWRASPPPRPPSPPPTPWWRPPPPPSPGQARPPLTTPPCSQLPTTPTTAQQVGSWQVRRPS